MNNIKNVLVIDRDKLVCKIIKIFLEKTGKYRVMYSTDTAKGLLAAANKRIDLILFDPCFETEEKRKLTEHIHGNLRKQIPLLPSDAVIDRARLRMPHTELNTVITLSILNQIDALLK